MTDAVMWWIALASLPPIGVRLWRQRDQRSTAWWLLWSVVVAAALCLAWAWPGWLAIKKMIAQLMLPPGLIWALLAGIFWILIERKRWALSGLCLLAWLTFTLAGSRPLGAQMLNDLASRIPAEHVHMMRTSVADVDGAVVLGGGTIIDSFCQPALGSAGDRLRVAAAGYHRGRYARIIVCGTPIMGLSRDHDPQESARKLLQDMGVPGHAILPINNETRTTAEGIQAIADWLQRHPQAHLNLVSSSWHLPRAMLLAERAGIADRLHPLSAQPTEVPLMNPEKIIPHGKGFENVQRACWEYPSL